MHTNLTLFELDQLELLALDDQVHESAGMALLLHRVREEQVRRHESRPGPRVPPPQIPPVPALVEWGMSDLFSAQTDLLEICRGHQEPRLRSFALDLAAELRGELIRRLRLLDGQPAEQTGPTTAEQDRHA